MQAHRCDRCGKFYLENGKCPTSNHILGSYISGIAFLSLDKSIDARNDLCDECVEDLFDFLTFDESKQRGPKEKDNDPQA